MEYVPSTKVVFKCNEPGHTSVGQHSNRDPCNNVSHSSLATRLANDVLRPPARYSASRNARAAALRSGVRRCTRYMLRHAGVLR